MLFTKEHEDLMTMFEREFRGHRMDKEEKSMWAKGNVYQSGETNNLFLAYRRGAAYAKALSYDPR